jgi:hypothetical protein
MENQEKECSTCQQNLNSMQKGMVVLSVYILITSIYGNIQLYHVLKEFIQNLF